MHQEPIQGTVNDWASRSFRALLVVERYGIDFHDQGNRSFYEVCRENGLDPAAVAAEIEGVSQPRGPVELDPSQAPRGRLEPLKGRPAP
jgi:iron-sulfur cluster repair protein YtfE (RIC family)